MLTLNTGSVCDVCSEDYGQNCVPHSIPCGHVLCLGCCNAIVEKTSPRLSPVCPFCREQFTMDSVRLVRIDLTASRWNNNNNNTNTTPRLRNANLDSNDHHYSSSSADRHHHHHSEERIVFMGQHSSSRSREEARRLEDKVAKVAAKKCSVEEVSTLHKELQQWLMSEVKADEQRSALALSAALLRAILVNHLAHSEASKVAKAVESELRTKLDDAELTNSKLEAEIRRQRLQYTQKLQECQSLRTELNRLKLITTTLGMSPSLTDGTTSPPNNESRHQSPTPPSTSPTPYSSSPLSRFNSSGTTSSHHTRSVSMSNNNTSLRSTTPAPPSITRSHTPSIRSHTPSIRSHTPSIRSQTPSIRSHASPHRSETPVPPLPTAPTTSPSAPPIPPKPRRLSQSSPPRMARTVSEESNKQEQQQQQRHEKLQQPQHQRWIPPHDPTMYSPPLGYAHAPGLTRPASAAPGATSSSSSSSRMMARSQTPFARYHSTAPVTAA